MNMKQSCKALICAIEGELDGRHCTEEQAAAILDHALPSLTEALARVEAERDSARLSVELWKEQYQSVVDCGNEIMAERDASQAQLAEAVGLLKYAMESSSFREILTLERDIAGFLARHAQAEQQETLATQPAAGEPKWSCLNAWFLSLEPGRQAVLREDKWMLAGAAFDAGRQFSAPPAAAHGDEAVQFEIADVVAVSREDLLAMSGDVCPSTGRSEMECLLAQWLKGHDIPVFRRRLYAMRAQAGEGGEV